VAGEAAEVAQVLTAAGRDVSAGLVIRPAEAPDRSDLDPSGRAMALVLGTEGQALSGALWAIAAFVEDVLRVRGPA
jgi:hypothetical protein